MPPPVTAAALALTYRAWAAQVGELAALAKAITVRGDALGLPSAGDAAWHGALFGKLAPQLDREPLLIVAVTGGTNTGKSVIFNHLAGVALSRSHPNATQTKHPVCSVPRGFLATRDVAGLFPDFDVRPWQSEDDPLVEGPDNRLFVREDPSPDGSQPQRLLLLDTPDIDGVLKANWRRADLVRHASDVLVCILTQQKYNDAAVRDFFTAAAAADKTVLVVFNMVHWPRQEAICRGWLDTFRQATGVEPMHVYAAPLDFEAAEAGRLPFHPLSAGATNPRTDLAELQFDAIKIRSLRGALRAVTDERQGLAAYLRAVRAASLRFSEARDLLREVLAETRVEMPELPRRLVWDEIFRWLESRRTRFDRAVHGFYSKIVSGIQALVRREQSPPLEAFKTQEWQRLSLAVTAVLDQLELHRRGGNEILRDVLGRILSGVERERLFNKLRERHAALPVIGDDYRTFIHRELDAWQAANPAAVKAITWGLVSTAVIRPVLTVGLGPFGAHGVDVLVGNMLPLAGDIAVGAVTVAGGESLLELGKGGVAALITRLFAGYYAQRAALLGRVLQEGIAGGEIARLGELADAGASGELRRAIELLEQLRAHTQ